MEDNDVKRGEYLTYDDMIQQAAKKGLESDDPKVIEAQGKFIESASKAQINEIAESTRIEQKETELALKKRELDIQEAKVEADKQYAILTFIGGLIGGTGGILSFAGRFVDRDTIFKWPGVVSYAEAHSDTLLNFNKMKLPNLFPRK